MIKKREKKKIPCAHMTKQTRDLLHAMHVSQEQGIIMVKSSDTHVEVLALKAGLYLKFRGPPLLSSISQGGFTGNFFYLGHITAKAFSYIRTAFGASRSMRVGVRLARN